MGEIHLSQLSTVWAPLSMVEIPVLHHVDEMESVRIGPRAQYSVTPDQLSAYLESREKFNTRLPEGKGGGNWLLLSFDDGYRSVLTEALPLLERFKVQAIVFVTTGFVSGDVYPYELELAAVVQHHDSLQLEAISRPVEVAENSAKSTLYRRLRQPLKTKSCQEREARLKRLSKLNSYDRSHFQNAHFLSWEEITDLDRHPLITIGAHTHTHPVLTRRAPWTAYREMKESKRKIEKVLGHDVLHFSYPYGRNNPLVRFLARRVGFQWAFTTETRCPESIDECDSMVLPRPEIHDLL